MGGLASLLAESAAPLLHGADTSEDVTESPLEAEAELLRRCPRCPLLVAEEIDAGGSLSATSA